MPVAVARAGIFHGIVLMPSSCWKSSPAWISALVAALGILPAFLSLTGGIGRRRQCRALIEATRQLAKELLEIDYRLQRWTGHRSGQFLLAEFGKAREGHHPFTIASAWNARQGTLTQCIKGCRIPHIASPPARQDRPHFLHWGAHIRSNSKPIAKLQEFICTTM